MSDLDLACPYMGIYCWHQGLNALNIWRYWQILTSPIYWHHQIIWRYWQILTSPIWRWHVHIWAHTADIRDLHIWPLTDTDITNMEMACPYGHILLTSGTECSQYIEILTDSDITNILTSKLEGVEPTVCSVAADNYHRCLIFSRHNITSIQTVAGGGFLTYDVCFAMFLTSGFVFIRAAQVNSNDINTTIKMTPNKKTFFPSTTAPKVARGTS